MYTKIGNVKMPFGVAMGRTARKIVTAAGRYKSGNLVDYLETHCHKPIGGQTSAQVRGLTPWQLQGMGLDLSDDERKDVHLFYHAIFRHVGAPEFTFPIVKYMKVDTPQLPYDRMLENMSGHTLVIPSGDKFKGLAEGMRLSTFLSFMPQLIRHVADHNQVEHEYEEQLKIAMSDIAYRIAVKAEVTQSELSFFVRWYKDPRFSSLPPRPGAVDRTKEVFRILEESTITGPASKFGFLLSNFDSEKLVWSWRPNITSAEMVSGNLRMLGDFIKLEKPEGRKDIVLDKYDFTMQDQLTALMEALRPGLKKAALFEEPIVEVVPGWEYVMDDKNEVTYELSTSTSIGASTAEFSYVGFHNRPMSSLLSATNTTFLRDRAAEGKSVGGGEQVVENIAEGEFMDLRDCGKNTIRILTKEEWVEYFLVPKRGERDELEVRKVDMSNFYSSYGKVVVRPPFTGHLVPPSTWLTVPDPRAEVKILNSLEIAPNDQARVEMAIRVAHNYQKMMRVLENTPATPIPIGEDVAVSGLKINARSEVNRKAIEQWTELVNPAAAKTLEEAVTL